MNLLIDTVTFIWICLNPSRLSEGAAALYEDSENTIYLSTISVYEIVVKSNLGKLDVGESPSSFVRRERAKRDISSLDVTEECVLTVERLPGIHADLFDRILVAQSIAHSMPIVTPDPYITKYPVRVLW